MSTDAQWRPVSFHTPQNIATGIDSTVSVIDGLSTILTATSELLDLVKIFIVDKSSTLEILLESLETIITSLKEDFSHSGIYLYVDKPLSEKDSPSVTFFGSNLQGGVDSWRDRMTAAFLSPGVPNQPHFSKTAAVSSMSILVTSGNAGQFITNMTFLLNMMGQKVLPSMEAPANVKAIPINSSFYENFYDHSKGKISKKKITQYALKIISGEAVVDGIGSQAIDRSNVSLVLRHDIITGEELIVDKVSGGVVARNTPYDAVLVSWRAVPGFTPIDFRLDRSESRLDRYETTSLTNPDGSTRVVNSLVVDEMGSPIRISDSSEVYYRVNPSELLNKDGYQSYLDTEIVPGVTYYYQVRSQISEGEIFDFPDIDLSTPAIQNLYAYYRSLKKCTEGLSDPSQQVSVRVPTPEEVDRIFSLHIKSLEDTERGWDTSLSPMGWRKVSVADIIKPVNVSISEMENNLKALKSSVSKASEDTEAFISSLQTRIHTLDQLIDTLNLILALLDLIQSKNFYCLTVSSDSGTAGVLEAINNASLPKAPEGSINDFIGGVTILGTTASAGPAMRALGLLFGTKED